MYDLGVLCCEFAPWNRNQENSSSLDSKFVLATGGNDDYVKLWTIVVGLSTKIQSRKKLSKEHNGAVMCVRSDPHIPLSDEGWYQILSGHLLHGTAKIFVVQLHKYLKTGWARVPVPIRLLRPCLFMYKIP